jgi:DNA invertase Pin-like site-specific DNA recombinase
MKVALYARVSTPKTDKKVTNEGDRARQDPDTQLIKLRAFAEARGYEVLREYVDRIRGEDAIRDALDAMKAAAFRHEFDAILIVRLDRIMRSLANFAALNQELTAAKVGLICIDQQIDTTTPAGRLQQNILAAFAEYEREAIRERVLDGIARARSEGKKLGRPTVSDEKASERTLRRRKAEAKKGEVRFFIHRGGENVIRQKDFFLSDPFFLIRRPI